MDAHCHSQYKLAVIQSPRVEFLTFFFSNVKQYIQYSPIIAEDRSGLFFYPELHTEDTLKAFLDFTQKFTPQYNAQFPDPPKVPLELAIERW